MPGGPRQGREQVRPGGVPPQCLSDGPLVSVWNALLLSCCVVRGCSAPGRAGKAGVQVPSGHWLCRPLASLVAEGSAGGPGSGHCPGVGGQPSGPPGTLPLEDSGVPTGPVEGAQALPGWTPSVLRGRGRCGWSDDQVSTALCRGVRGVCSSGWGQLGSRCQVGNRQEALPASAMLQDPCPGPGVRSGSVGAQRPRVRAVEKVKRGGAGPRRSGQSLQWLPWARAGVGSQGQRSDGAACGKRSPWPWGMLW